MIFNVELYLLIILLLLYVNITMIMVLTLRKLLKHEAADNRKQLLGNLYNIASNKIRKIKHARLLDGYESIKQSVVLSEEHSRNFKSALSLERNERRYGRKLKSMFRVDRIEGAVYLAAIGTDSARIALEHAIKREKDFPVKLYMANALSDIGDNRSIPVLVGTLINSHRWYRDKVNMIVCGFEGGFHDYLPAIEKSDDFEIKELIVEFSSAYISENLKNYLMRLVDGYEEKVERLSRSKAPKKKSTCFSCIHGKRMTAKGDRICAIKGVVSPEFSCGKYRIYPSSYFQVDNYKRLVYRAAEILSENYYRELDDIRFYTHSDLSIRRIAVGALHNYRSPERFIELMDRLYDSEVADSAAQAIRKVISRDSGYLKYVFQRASSEKDGDAKRHLVDILSMRIEYLIMKLANSHSAKDLLKRIILSGHTGQFIWFMNKNHDDTVERQLISIVRETVKANIALENVFAKYLDKRLVDACDLTHHLEKKVRKKGKKDVKFIRMMYVIVISIILFGPAVYVARHWADIGFYAWEYHIRNYIIDFNYYLAAYSVSINAIYVALLVLSMSAAKKQMKLWSFKNETMLFKNRMLPSVSIIAPAYNEEKTISESVHSLLNLKYPDYELIVVNDGSKDDTMGTLTRTFGLELADRHFDERLKTMPIRGIYTNPSIPKLIVVDKENGGKADALNAGINVSTREYFCGIDADSMLEADALLKLASLTLDAGVEIPALGGSILPVNGCKVDKGRIVETNIPKYRTARFQTVEYVRSFMTGRLGWAAMDAMIIISGAFGLFRKERIIATGGYLTSNEKYKKDTVGEDMEMVVRVRRLMYEMKLKHSVGFAFDANCWTQVPEDSNSLKRQRQRWGRGLADTLTFHGKMIMNPRYGRVGMLSMPYFFIFELAGPIIEIEGYIMVLMALFMGYLNLQIALMLFITTILLGVFVSISSFVILERTHTRFRTKDMLKLLGYAVMENFGPRQLAALWRAGAIIRLLSGDDGWGKIERIKFRKGSKSEPESSDKDKESEETIEISS